MKSESKSESKFESGNITLDHRSLCPVSRSLDLVGDRWTLLIMRDALFLDCKTFADFASCREGIPTNLLTDRLQKLVGLGLLARVPYQERPARYHYLPTEFGESVKPMLRAMKQFGESHLGGCIETQKDRGHG